MSGAKDFFIFGVDECTGNGTHFDKEYRIGVEHKFGITYDV
jgi:hypothetical protein